MSEKEYPSKKWEPGWFTKTIEKGARQYEEIVKILEESLEELKEGEE